MWPFIENFDLPGTKRDKEGNLIFELTDEEQNAVDKSFKIFDGYVFNPDFVDDFRNGLTASALSIYAREQIMLSEAEAKEKTRKKLIYKGIAAIAKAYSIYQLPIYIYDFACFIEMVGRVDVAKETFQNFLKEQEKFKPAEFDKAFLGQRNIDAAIQDAKEKTMCQ
jgi:hypothetical protein